MEIMTGAEQLHFEGKKEGREEGREETKHLIAKRLLKEGADLNFITHVTGLSKDAIQNIVITVEKFSNNGQ